MKGEIFERVKHIVLNIVEKTIKTAWEVVTIDELAFEIAWEALNLFGLYIILRLLKQILPITEYIHPDVKTSLIELVEERVGQEIKKIGNLFEIDESRLWQIFRLYRILQAEIDMLESLIKDYKKDVLLQDNLIIELDYTSVLLPAPRVTEALTSSYCC